MYSLTWELPSIRQQLILVLLRLYSSADGIKGGLGCFHALLHYGVIVYKGLESLSIIALKHELQLLPAFAVVDSLISLDVQGIQVIEGCGVEGSPILRLVGGMEVENGSIPMVIWARGGNYTKGKCWACTGFELMYWGKIS